MQNEPYLGWSNWDTWETFNVLSSDETIYQEIQIVACDSNIMYFGTIVKEALKRWYLKHSIDISQQVDIAHINMAELKKSISSN